MAFRSHRPLASGSISSGSSRPEAPGPRILEWRPTPARNGTKLSSGHGCGATTLHWTRRADYRRLPLRIPGVSPKPATRRPRAEPLQCGVNFGDIVAAEVANTIGGLSVSDLKQHVRYVGNNPGRIITGLIVRPQPAFVTASNAIWRTWNGRNAAGTSRRRRETLAASHFPGNEAVNFGENQPIGVAARDHPRPCPEPSRTG